jgi:hypothetical protein
MKKIPVFFFFYFWMANNEDQATYFLRGFLKAKNSLIVQWKYNETYRSS